MGELHVMGYHQHDLWIFIEDIERCQLSVIVR